MSADCGLRGLALLDAVIAQIEAHPETWDQRAWRQCGTTMCVAGWACEMTGAEWHGSDGAGLRTPDGRESNAFHRGAEVLGLDHPAAVRLFIISEGLDDIRAFRDRLRAREAAKAGEPS